MRAFVVLLFLLSTIVLSAQKSSADTIRREIAALSPEDPHYLESKIGGMRTLFMTVVNSDPKEALRIDEQLVALMEKNPITDSAAYFEVQYRYKAIAYAQLGDYTRYIRFLEAYAEAMNSIGKMDGYAYVDIGNAYYRFGLMTLAKESYWQALYAFRKEKNVQGRCTVHNNFAQIYLSQKNYDSALYEMRRTKALRTDELKDPIVAGDSKLLMGICFREMKQYDSAEYYLRQVIATFNDPAINTHTDRIALREEYAGAYNALAQVFVEKHEWDSAARYLREGAVVFARNGYDRRTTSSYAIWARYYLGKKMNDSALACIRRMDATPIVHQSPDMRLRLYELYADYFDAAGNKEQYYRYRMLYHQESDSMRGQTLDESWLMAGSVVKELRDKSRIEHQQAELARKDEVVAKQQREKILLYAFTGLLLFVVAGGLFFFFQIRKKNRLIEQYNEELQEANLTKEKFLSVISHDLRSPFNTLIGMSNILVSSVKSNDLTKVAANAEAIHEASRKAYVLLDNLMQWVSLQKEKISVVRAPLQVTSTVDEVLRLFRNQALAQSITITKTIRVDHIHSDRNLLQVVLRNLLSNAIRHIPAGGTVRICVDKKDKDALITIEDNGPGIDDETLSQLFAQKEQINIARKGGGLGLMLVHEFVTQMDGTITAENVPSGGAKFTIVLKDAAEADIFDGAEENLPLRAVALTPDEQKRLAEFVTALSAYEIFDTTELRKLIDTFDVGHSVALADWLNRVSQAVYHANDEQFKKLMDLARA